MKTESTRSLEAIKQSIQSHLALEGKPSAPELKQYIEALEMVLEMERDFEPTTESKSLIELFKGHLFVSASYGAHNAGDLAIQKEVERAEIKSGIPCLNATFATNGRITVNTKDKKFVFEGHTETEYDVFYKSLVDFNEQEANNE